ncbi:MAG: hypothetical protein K8L97_14445 [Anaerolineae bacterium]|nr:hypothetical protein [Anaerolineae bacterium]
MLIQAGRYEEARALMATMTPAETDELLSAVGATGEGVGSVQRSLDAWAAKEQVIFRYAGIGLMIAGVGLFLLNPFGAQVSRGAADIFLLICYGLVVLGGAFLLWYSTQARRIRRHLLTIRPQQLQTTVPLMLGLGMVNLVVGLISRGTALGGVQVLAGLALLGASWLGWWRRKQAERLG